MAKDLSYSAGSRADNSRSNSAVRQNQGSNLRIGKKLDTYSANKASISNLLNTSNASGTRGYNDHSGGRGYDDGS